MTVCTLGGMTDSRNPEMADGNSGKVMAASEIPMVGYQSRLLSRVEVAQDTMAFHFENQQDLTSNLDNQWTYR